MDNTTKKPTSNIGSKQNKYPLIIGGIILLMIIALVAWFMLRPQGYRVIKMLEIFGEVRLDRGDRENIRVYDDMNLQSGDNMRTGANESYCRLVLDEDKYVYVAEKTEVGFEMAGSGGSSLTKLNVKSGAVVNELESPLMSGESFEVKTPNATMAVRGTRFRVSVYEGPDGVLYSRVSVMEGKVTTNLVFPDGTVAPETVMVDSSYETLIYYNPQNSEVDYVRFDTNGNMVIGDVSGNHSLTRKVDYESFPDQTLKYMERRMDSGVKYDGIESGKLKDILDSPNRSNLREPGMRPGNNGNNRNPLGNSESQPNGNGNAYGRNQDGLNNNNNQVTTGLEGADTGNNQNNLQNQQDQQNQQNQTQQDTLNQLSQIQDNNNLGNNLLSQFGQQMADNAQQENNQTAQPEGGGGGGGDEDDDEEESETEYEPETESPSEFETEYETESVMETESELISEEFSEMETGMESESESQQETSAESESIAESESEAESKSESEDESEVESETQSAAPSPPRDPYPFFGNPPGTAEEPILYFEMTAAKPIVNSPVITLAGDGIGVWSQGIMKNTSGTKYKDASVKYNMDVYLVDDQGMETLINGYEGACDYPHGGLEFTSPENPQLTAGKRVFLRLSLLDFDGPETACVMLSYTQCPVIDITIDATGKESQDVANEILEAYKKGAKNVTLTGSPNWDLEYPPIIGVVVPEDGTLIVEKGNAPFEGIDVYGHAIFKETTRIFGESRIFDDAKVDIESNRYLSAQNADIKVYGTINGRIDIAVTSDITVDGGYIESLNATYKSGETQTVTFESARIDKLDLFNYNITFDGGKVGNVSGNGRIALNGATLKLNSGQYFNAGPSGEGSGLGMSGGTTTVYVTTLGDSVNNIETVSNSTVNVQSGSIFYSDGQIEAGNEKYMIIGDGGSIVMKGGSTLKLEGGNTFDDLGSGDAVIYKAKDEPEEIVRLSYEGTPDPDDPDNPTSVFFRQ